MSIEDNVIAVLTDKVNRDHFTGKYYVLLNYDYTLLAINSQIRSCYFIFSIVEQAAASHAPADFDKECLLDHTQIGELVDKAIAAVMSQPMLLEIDPPLNICGKMIEFRFVITYRCLDSIFPSRE